MAEMRIRYQTWMKIGLAMYAVICLIFFIFMRFPYDSLKSRAEDNLSTVMGREVTLGHVHPKFIFGVTVDGILIKGVRVARKVSISPRFMDIFRGSIGFGFDAALASGSTQGYLRLPMRKSKRPQEIKVTMENMDLSAIANVFPPALRPRGIITCELNLSAPKDSMDKATGNLTLNWKKGLLPLGTGAGTETLPFDEITFDNLDLEARVQNGLLNIEKGDFSGQFSGNVRGSIRLAREIKSSRLHITGELNLPEDMRKSLGNGQGIPPQATRFALRGSLGMLNGRIISPGSGRLNQRPTPDVTATAPAVAQQERRVSERAAASLAPATLERRRPASVRQDVVPSAQQELDTSDNRLQQGQGQDENQPKQPSELEGE